MIAKDVKDKNECFSCEEECLFVDLSVTYRLIMKCYYLLDGYICHDSHL